MLGLPPLGSQAKSDEVAPVGEMQRNELRIDSSDDQVTPCRAAVAPDAKLALLVEVRKRPDLAAGAATGRGAEHGGTGEDARLAGETSGSSTEVIVNISRHRPAAEQIGKRVADLHRLSVVEAGPDCRW